MFSSSKLLCACFAPSTDGMEECEQESGDLQEKKISGDGESAVSLEMEVCNYESQVATTTPQAPFSAAELDREIKLDIEEVINTYEQLLSCGHEGVVNSLMHALVNLSSDMSLNSARCEDPVSLKQFLITLAHPQLLDPDYLPILRSLIVAMDRLPSLSRNSIVQWLQTATSQSVYCHFLEVIRQCITLRIYQGAVDDARRAVRIQGLLYAALPSFPSVPASEFINEALCDEYISSVEARKREYKMWLNDLGTTTTTSAQGVSVPMMVSGSVTSFISFPFVLTAAAKAAILELDAAVQMRQVCKYI